MTIAQWYWQHVSMEEKTMKEATYQGSGLPNHYGHFFIAPDEAEIHPIEILRHLKTVICGTLLDLLGIKLRMETHDHNRFKMGEPKFLRQLELQQTVKYGALLYMVVVMAAIPAGICNTSYQPMTIGSPIIAPPQVPVALKAQTDTAPTQISEVATEERSPETQIQAKKPDEPPFHSHILRASRTYDVDAALIRAIIMAESNNNPRAVSHRGAQGLMQLMPTTAKWLGVEDAFDPALNIDGGVRYFKKLLDRFNGDIKLALAAYNAGSRYVRKYGGVPPFRATRIYIQKVLKYQQEFQKETASTLASLTMSL
jgi:soluble lytic murein transglycosylase-like protein